MKSKMLFVLFIIFMLPLTGCQTDTASTTQSDNGYPVLLPETSSTSEEPAYPVSENAPVINDTILNEIPEPDMETATVYGIMKSNITGEPIPFTKIYLASKIPVEPGNEYVFSYKEKSSPQFQTNSLGEFIIDNIPPGEYILIMVTPVETHPLLNINGEQIEFSIKGGELFDLGEVLVQWPILK